MGRRQKSKNNVSQPSGKPASVLEWDMDMFVASAFNHSYDFRDTRLARSSKSRAKDILDIGGKDHVTTMPQPKRAANPHRKPTPALAFSPNRTSSYIARELLAYRVTHGLAHPSRLPGGCTGTAHTAAPTTTMTILPAFTPPPTPQPYRLPFLLAGDRRRYVEAEEIRRADDAGKPTPYIKIQRNVFTHRLPAPFHVDLCLCHKVGATCQTENCINRAMKIECGKGHCKGGEQCGNQRFQRMQWKKLSVFKTEGTGFGLRAEEAIGAGEFVLEYVGELIDEAEATRRVTTVYSQEKNFYLLTISQNDVIDASRKGNIGRFINHSCDPSCETQKWNVTGEIRIGVFAVRDLAVGEEITFDYKFQRVRGSKKQPCHCGSPKCRGFLGEPKESKRSASVPALPPRPPSPLRRVRLRSGRDVSLESERCHQEEMEAWQRQVDAHENKYGSRDHATQGVLRRHSSGLTVRTKLFRTQIPPREILRSLVQATGLPTGTTPRHRRRAGILHRNKRAGRIGLLLAEPGLQSVVCWDESREVNGALNRMAQLGREKAVGSGRGGKLACRLL